MKQKIRNIEDERDLSNLDGIEFSFITEEGIRNIEYREYLDDVNLRSKVNDGDRYKLVLGRSVFSYTTDYLKAHPKAMQLMRDLEEERRKNPLRFFAPSGKAALNFLNDEENDINILTAPNRAGKTQTMLIKKLINIIPCDPTWEIFSKYGVTHRAWRGAKTCGFASYELGSHQSTILPMLLDWLPKSELGNYSKDYKGKGARQVTLRVDPNLPLSCGSTIGFYAISQGQARFESNVVEDWGWDEQGEEARFDGADERSRTTPSGGRHDFGMTPHKIEGRPDTGAGSWINKLFDGSVTKGRSIGTYHMRVWDVPDWIYPEESKVKAFNKWVVEPEAMQNNKVLREGESRFFGKWHESSGLVIDEWDSKVHVISPFDIPRHWSRFRAVDHGDKHPAAGLWGALSPAGDLFFYRDYLRKGRVPSQICQDIIELSGNTRRLIGSYSNPKNERVYSRYEEIQNGESFQWTVFDARAFSTNSSGDGITLSKLYEFDGLKMKKGSGHDSDHYVPILKEWFCVDPNKKHFVTGEMGAPRVYVFDTCTDFIRTIKRWVWVDRKTKSSERLAKESPTKTDDDLCDCMKLMIQANPRFRGNARMGDSAYYDGIEHDTEPNKLKTGGFQNNLTGY